MTSIKRKLTVVFGLMMMVFLGWTSYHCPPYGDYSLEPGYGATLHPGDGIKVRNDNPPGGGDLKFTLFDENGNPVGSVTLPPGAEGELFVPDPYNGSEVVLMVGWRTPQGNFGYFDGDYYWIEKKPV